MSIYLIGDIQGCDDALARLLQHIAFSPSRDTLYLLARQIERNRRRFVSHAQGVVNGKLVFETRITGMTF